jgi:chemotaxis family two-component system response regulator Rcp1
MINVLLIEDNFGDVLLVKEALATYEIENRLHVLSDGQKALEFVQGMGQAGGARCPDIILLDLNLPKVDGEVVLAAIREHPGCTDTPVIIMTSSDSAADRRKAGSLGVKHYFRKPSDLDGFIKLGEIVRTVLKSRPA